MVISWRLTDTREIRDKQSDVSVICREMVVGARSMPGKSRGQIVPDPWGTSMFMWENDG